MGNGQKTVLIVEDEKAYRTVLQNKLQSAGVNIKVAEDGDKALQLIEEVKPELVVLDLILPGKDGFEVLRQIKDKNPAGTKVIVLSNLGQEEDVDKARQLGAADYIIKTETVLADAIKKILTYL